MKKTILSIVVITLFSTILKAQVKIGENPISINSNSLLELESTNKGLLLPRLTKIQMQQMTNVPNGMVVYNITDSTLSVHRDTGWTQLADKINPNAAFEVNDNDIYNTNSGNVGIGTSAPSQKLEVAGQVYSTSNGFKFPDATVQTSAITKFVGAFTATGPKDFVISHGLKFYRCVHYCLQYSNAIWNGTCDSCRISKPFTFRNC